MTERDHLKRHLSERFALRLHFLVLVGAVTLFGAGVNRALLAHGIESMAFRNLVVMPASYLFFFALVKVWLDRVIPEWGHELERLEAEPRVVPERPAGRAHSSWWDVLDIPDFGEGFLIGLAFIVVFGAALWIGIEGPFLLADVVLDAALSAGLAGVARRRIQKSNAEGGDWHIGLLARTLIVFLLMLGASTFLLEFAAKTCPGKPRMALVIKECWLK